jgi:hypothetical protein
MKQFKVLAIAMMAMIGATSCSSFSKTSTAVAVETNAYALTVADVDVKAARVTRTASWEFNPFSSVSIESRKSELVAEVVAAEDCDILIEPEYSIKKTFLGLGGGSVTVTGYPAKLTNFHKPTPQELDAIKTVKDNNKSKKSRKFLFF